MKISAVIFDLDGTLTDSVRLFQAAVAHGLSTFGVAMNQDHFNEWHTNFHPWSRLFELHGKCDIDEHEMERVMMIKLQELLARESAWMVDAEETIRALKKRGMPMAVVTNAPAESIETMCHSLPLKEHFPIIITATLMKERRKPDPYGLLLAAEKLGVNPLECIFVGDQRFDMLAAQGAGMHDCLFVGPHTPPEVELMAKHRIRRLPEIFKLID